MLTYESVISLAENVPPQSVRVYCAVLILSDGEERPINPHLDEITEITGMDDREIRRALATLEESGLVERTFRHKKPTILVPRHIRVDRIRSAKAPPDLIKIATEQILHEWSALWAQRYGLKPKPDSATRQHAERIAEKMVDRGPTQVSTFLAKTFAGLSAPTLKNILHKC